MRLKWRELDETMILEGGWKIRLSLNWWLCERYRTMWSGVLSSGLAILPWSCDRDFFHFGTISELKKKILSLDNSDSFMLRSLVTRWYFWLILINYSQLDCEIQVTTDHKYTDRLKIYYSIINWMSHEIKCLNYVDVCNL